MTRLCFLTLALALGLLGGRLAAADRTNTDALREQLRGVERQIDEKRTQIRNEIQAEVDAKPGTNVDWTAVNEALQGELFPDKIRRAEGEVGFETSAPLGARELRDKLVAFRQPLDQLDAQVQAHRAEYDRLKRLGGWDFGGFTRPYGAYSDEMRALLKQIAQLQEERPKVIQQIEARMAADTDTAHYKTLAAFEKGVQRAYQQYYDRILGAGSAGGPSGILDRIFYSSGSTTAESRAVRIRRLLVELSALIADRDRLLRLLSDAQNRWVVWYNEIGWLYVGTVEEWERQKFRTRGSETWGGRGSEPLLSTQILKDREFWSQAEAVKALLHECGGPGYMARHPLAFPKVTWNVKLGGKEYYLTDSILGDAGYQAAAKAAEEAAKANP